MVLEDLMATLVVKIASGNELSTVHAPRLVKGVCRVWHVVAPRGILPLRRRWLPWDHWIPSAISVCEPFSSWDQCWECAALKYPKSSGMVKKTDQ